MVDDLLHVRLGQKTCGQITLCIDVQEVGVTANGHGGTILLLNRSEVSHVEPLNCLLEVLSRTTKIQTINGAQLLKLFKGTYLLRELLTMADNLFRHGGRSTVLLSILVCNQTIHTIQCNATIIANNAATAICVGQARNNVTVTTSAHLRRIGIKYTSVMRLTIVGIDVYDLRVYVVTILLTSSNGHTNTTVDHKRTLEGLIGL